MITIQTANIFDERGDAVCVTTNGIVKTNGEAVMGAGMAKEANIRYNLARELGIKLHSGGNHCYIIGRSDKAIVSFPTKYHWRDASDIELIKQSCCEIKSLADENNWDRVLLPMVGCGCGRLDTNIVRKTMEKFLDDRFVLCLR